ncbi:PREDICTED: myb-like protein V isoform X1 [Fragaria vesca subsp. vesca]|uniref:myb-like protein V isoform X1 n=1 Tax=Fragaria vesca subsp. vesca TaxID=101020 RepID=UPI0002C340DC|nr:PREDICTED: myb-like protein V isoform X1 [Fragaria vesca subsp. vesca]
MPKHSDPSDEETSSSGSEEQNPQAGGGAVPEYEKQRQARIAHNRARMEALGLPKMASSLMGSAQNATKRSRKGKGKVLEEDDDEEYRPEEEGHGFSSEEEEADDDEDYEDEELSSARKKKNKGRKHKNARSRSSLSNSDYLDDDEALKQAIALSLQGSAVSDVVKDTVNVGENQTQQDSVRKRKKPQSASRLQMTEDELVLHFFQFDENCNGGISARNLEKLAVAHDFIWTDKEVADMIHLFDSDGDAKLSLEDFRKIVVRCNMIKAPENS